MTRITQSKTMDPNIFNLKKHELVTYSISVQTPLIRLNEQAIVIGTPEN